MEELEAMRFPNETDQEQTDQEQVVTELSPEQIRGMQAIEIFNSLFKSRTLGLYNKSLLAYRIHLTVPSTTIEKSKVLNFTNYLMDKEPGSAQKFQSIISNITGVVVDKGDYRASIRSYLKYFGFDESIALDLEDIIYYTLDSEGLRPIDRTRLIFEAYKRAYDKMGLPTIGNDYHTCQSVINALRDYTECQVQVNKYKNEIKNIIRHSSSLPMDYYETTLDSLNALPGLTESYPKMPVKERREIIVKTTIKIISDILKHTHATPLTEEDIERVTTECLIKSNYPKDVCKYLNKVLDTVYFHKLIKGIKSRLYKTIMDETKQPN